MTARSLFEKALTISFGANDAEEIIDTMTEEEMKALMNFASELTSITWDTAANATIAEINLCGTVTEKEAKEVFLKNLYP